MNAKQKKTFDDQIKAFVSLPAETGKKMDFLVECLFTEINETKKCPIFFQAHNKRTPANYYRSNKNVKCLMSFMQLHDFV